MNLGRLFYLICRDWQRGTKVWWHDYFVAQKISQFQYPAHQQKYEDTPLHILTGKEDWILACWMLASWHHFTQKQWHITIHDDGTLPQEGKELLQKIFPKLRIISRKEADQKMEKILRAYPRCAFYRNQFPLALKIFDIPMYCGADRFILFDSDLLFFATPNEILHWVDFPEDRCLFNQDVQEACPLDFQEVERKFSIRLVPRINSGIALLYRKAIDLPFCEMCLNLTSLSQAKPWRIEQTLFALCCCRKNQADLLPPTYEISLEPHAKPTSIARHYVGAVRQQFFAEGIAKLKHLLLS